MTMVIVECYRRVSAIFEGGISLSTMILSGAVIEWQTWVSAELTSSGTVECCPLTAVQPRVSSAVLEHFRWVIFPIATIQCHTVECQAHQSLSWVQAHRRVSASTSSSECKHIVEWVQRQLWRANDIYEPLHVRPSKFRTNDLPVKRLAIPVRFRDEVGMSRAEVGLDVAVS